MIEFLSLINLGSLTALGAVAAILTSVLKAMPVDWFSDRPKITCWVVSALVVVAVGVYTKSSVEMMTAVTAGTAVIAHGLYDVVKAIWVKIF